MYLGDYFLSAWIFFGECRKRYNETRISRHNGSSFDVVKNHPSKACGTYLALGTHLSICWHYRIQNWCCLCKRAEVSNTCSRFGSSTDTTRFD